MNQIIQEFLETYRHNWRLRRRCRCAFIALAVLVIGGVIWQMKQPGISLSETLVCPLEEHQHTDECYTQVLVCGLEESDDQVISGHKHTEECYETYLVCTCGIEEHIHGDECFDETGTLVCTHQEHTHSMGCYDEDGNLTCNLQEHSHTEDCYDENGNLICTLPEHSHCVSCFTSEEELVCGLEETEDQVIPGHTHTDECYESQLTCEKTEHSHTAECYANPETEADSMDGTPASDETPAPDGTPASDGTPAPDETPTPDDSEITELTPIPQSPDSSAFAYHLASSNSTVRRAAPFAASRANEGGTDFGSYITSIDVKKSQGGQWVEVGGNTVQVGDYVQVTIHYTIPDGSQVTSDNPVIFYQMPDGINLSDQTQGNVYSDASTVVGTYSITQDGYIEIAFSPDFLDGTTFSGNIQFQGMVAAGENNESYDISFGNSGGIIHVEPNPDIAALAITKEVVNQDHIDNLQYKITISSQLGTSDQDIQLTDWFYKAEGASALDYTNETVYKVTNSGEKTDITSTLSPTVTGSETTSPILSILNLPALSPGESYEVVYTVACTPVAGKSGYDLSLGNVAEAKAGEDAVRAAEQVDRSGTMVNKTGAYDAETDTLTYDVHINEAYQNIGGWTIDDTLTVGNKTIHVDRVTLTAYGGSFENVSLPFRIPDSFNGPITLHYTIENVSQLIGDQSISSISNKVNVGMYQDTHTVDIIGEGYGIIKEVVTQGEPEVVPEPDWAREIKWKSTITIPSNVEPFTYTDQLTAFNHEGISHENYHVTTLDVLATTLKVEISGLYIEPTLLASDYYTPLINGEPFDWSDPTVWGITITNFGIFFPEATTQMFQDYQIHTITISYSTALIMDNLLNDDGSYKANGTYSVGNTGIIPAHTSSAELTWEVSNELVKEASPTGIAENGNTDSYTNSPLSVSFEQNNGILYYRLRISPGQITGDIVVTDTLPEGATFVNGSVILQGYKTDYSSITLDNHASATVEGNKVTFTIPAAAYAEAQGKGYTQLALYYQVSVANDSRWEDPTTESVTYTNTASWQDEVSLSTEVTRAVNKVEKSGELLVDEENNPTDTVKYTVVVNPHGQDLVPGNNTIELTDQLTMADYLSAELLAQTIGVYRYDKTKPDGIGEKLTSGYEITYDPDSYLITFSLPDATPLIVVYEYTIDHSQSSQSVTIRNTATLNGTAYETSVEDVVFDHVDSSASVNKATMTIYKVDSDTLETLPGAQFKMERYEDPEGDGNYAWTTSSLTATGADGIFEVGEDGFIKLDFLEHEDGRGSLYDTLYRMWEIKAPSGYEKSNDYFYFVWLKDGQSKEQAIAAMAPQGIFGTEEGQVNPDQVEFIAFSTNSSHYVPNTAKELSVQKEWKDFQGNDLETDLPTSVEVTLYQYAKDNRENAQPYGTSVTLNADNEWSHTWKALPTENDQGIEVYYYVQETSNPEGYVVTYSENNGVASTINEGTITITNKKESTYLLPETGGVGPVLWSICGSAFLIVSAGLGISVIKIKKGGKSRRSL